MDEKKYLAGQLDRWKRRLQLAQVADYATLGAAAGGGAAVVCEAAALIRPFYEAHLAAGLCFAAGALAGVLYALCKRVGREQAARRLDSFGLQERMLTACGQLEKEDVMARLQRQDALLHYKKIHEKIRIPLRPRRRHALALILAAFATVGLAFIPSPAREQARLLREVQEKAKEEQETLEELLDSLMEIEETALTEEQKERLKELSEALALSMEELAKADSRESLQAALDRLAYKYGQTAQTLESLAAALENPQAVGLADAQALAKAAAKTGGWQTAQAGAGEPGGKEAESFGDKGPGDGDGSGKESGAGDGDGSEKGAGAGEGAGNGDGAGNGNGAGDGDGAGNGNGSGDGAGAGNGPGRGSGSSNTAHDYVSIPGNIGNDAALTGEKNGGENSDYYRAQNGLAWEGEHVDYNSVIGEYTENAYEGIANGRYPSGMEPIIRDYFESLNQ